MTLGVGEAMVASTAMQLVGGGISGIFGSKQSKRAAKRQLRYSLHYDMESPAAKVEGLRRAGINPIIAFGSGGQGMTPTYGGSGQMAPGIDFDMPNVSATAKDLSQIELNGKKALTQIEEAALKRQQEGVAAQNELLIMREIKKNVQEMNLISQKAYFTLEQRELLEKQIEVMNYNMQKLRELSEVYDGPLGFLVAYINAILGNINITGGFLKK